MAKDANLKKNATSNTKSNSRPKQNPAFDAEARKATLAAKRNELAALFIGKEVQLQLESPFGKDGLISQLTLAEIEELIEYAKTKRSFIELERTAEPGSAKRIEIGRERKNSIRVVHLNTQTATDILTALPIIDEVANQAAESISRQLKRGIIPDAKAYGPLQSVNAGVAEIKDRLLPLVDLAVSSGIVRDKKMIAEYHSRRDQEEYKKYGIDGTDPKAPELLKNAKAAEKAERIATSEKAAELNKKLAEQLKIDTTTAQGKKRLQAVKKAMVQNSIDPAADNAVELYTALEVQTPDAKVDTAPASSAGSKVKKDTPKDA